MQIQSVKPNNFGTNFTLSKKAINSASKVTKLSEEEMKSLSPEAARKLMKERGSIKQPSKIKQFFADIYKKIGEKLGFLKPEYLIYTDID